MKTIVEFYTYQADACVVVVASNSNNNNSSDINKSKNKLRRQRVTRFVGLNKHEMNIFVIRQKL